MEPKHSIPYSHRPTPASPPEGQKQSCSCARHESMQGNGGTDPPGLNHRTSWRLMTCFTSRPIYLWLKNSHYSLHRRLGGLFRAERSSKLWPHDWDVSRQRSGLIFKSQDVHEEWRFWYLKIMPPRCLETSKTDIVKRRHIPEKQTPRLRHCKNLKRLPLPGPARILDTILTELSSRLPWPDKTARGKECLTHGIALSKRQPFLRSCQRNVCMLHSTRTCPKYA